MRYYNPSTGRYISEDPIGFLGLDVNLYRYVNNKSVSYNDPFGLTALYGGVSSGLGVGSSVGNNFFSGGVGGFIGDTKNPGNEIGLLSSSATGNIKGVSVGFGFFAGMNFGNIEDLAGPSRSIGIILLGFQFEITTDDKAGEITGFQFGFGGRGVGIGVYSLRNLTNILPFGDPREKVMNKDLNRCVRR